MVIDQVIKFIAAHLPRSIAAHRLYSRGTCPLGPRLSAATNYLERQRTQIVSTKTPKNAKQKHA